MRGPHWGLWEGFDLGGDASGEGLVVKDSSSATMGAMEIEGFDTGIEVYGASYLYGEDSAMTAGWLYVHDVANACVYVEGSSAAKMPYLECVNAVKYGVYVNYHSSLEAQFASVSGPSIGVYVKDSSYANLDDVTVSSSVDSGISVVSASNARVLRAVVTGSAWDGVQTSGASYVDASYAIVSGTGRIGFNVGIGSTAQASYSSSDGTSAYESQQGAYLGAEYTTSNASLYDYWTSNNAYIDAEGANGGRFVYSVGNDTTDFVYGL